MSIEIVEIRIPDSMDVGIIVGWSDSGDRFRNRSVVARSSISRIKHDEISAYIPYNQSTPDRMHIPMATLLSPVQARAVTFS